jgi:hypothetical protein
VRRVTAIEPECCRVFAHHAIDRIRVHAATLIAALAVVAQRPEQGPIDVGTVSGFVEVHARNLYHDVSAR